MGLIPDCFVSNERGIPIKREALLKIIGYAFNAAPSELGINLDDDGNRVGMFWGGNAVPRYYSIHSHPEGIAFPSEGDLDVMITYFGGGVDHTILSVRADLKRAVLRSYNIKFNLERTLIEFEGERCSEIRFENGMFETIYQETENVKERVDSMAEFMQVAMPERFYSLLEK